MPLQFSFISYLCYLQIILMGGMVVYALIRKRKPPKLPILHKLKIVSELKLIKFILLMEITLLTYTWFSI